MTRLLTAAALIAASLSPAFAAAGDEYRAQAYRDPAYNQNRGNFADNPAFTQGCPIGAIPEPYPNGNGRRCALPNGGYSY